VESLANDMDVPAAFVFKRRLSGDKTEITGVSADVEGKTVVIYDDMIRTGGSLIQAAKAYQSAGAKALYAITTHGLFNQNALERLQGAGVFQKIISTNTHPNAHQLQSDFLEVRSVAALLVAKLKTL